MRYTHQVQGTTSTSLPSRIPDDLPTSSLPSPKSAPPADSTPSPSFDSPNSALLAPPSSIPLPSEDDSDLVPSEPTSDEIDLITLAELHRSCGVVRFLHVFSAQAEIPMMLKELDKKKAARTLQIVTMRQEQETRRKLPEEDQWTAEEERVWWEEGQISREEEALEAQSRKRLCKNDERAQSSLFDARRCGIPTDVEGRDAFFDEAVLTLTYVVGGHAVSSDPLLPPQVARLISLLFADSPDPRFLRPSLFDPALLSDIVTWVHDARKAGKMALEEAEERSPDEGLLVAPSGLDEGRLPQAWYALPLLCCQGLS